MESSDRPTPSDAQAPDPAPPAADGAIDNTSPDVPLGAGLDLSDPNSPLAPLYLRFSHLAALALIVLFVLYAHLVPLGPDVWAPLALGRWAADNGRIPTHEPLSAFSDPDAPLPASGWLARACLFRTYRLGAALAGGNDVSRLEGGVELLHVVHLLLVAVLGGLAAAAYARRAGSLALGCLGLLLLMAAAPLLFGSLRPGLFGAVCFVALLALVGRRAHGESEIEFVPSWREVALVPALLALWANLDPSFVLGLALLALLLLGRLIEARDGRALRLFAALAGSALLAGLLTPDGPALWPRLWAWASRPPLDDLPFWSAMDFSAWKTVHFVFLAALAGLALAGAYSGRAYSPAEMAALLGFCALALWKQGAMAWWFLLVPWLLLPQLAALGRRLSWQAPASTPCLRKTFAGVLLGLVLLLLVLPVGWMRGNQPRPLAQALTPNTPWPVAVRLRGAGESSSSSVPLPGLTAQLGAAYPEGKFTGVILADESASDFLLFAAPEHPVFVYGEVGLFPPRHWEEYQAIRGVRADWWELLDRRGVNLIVLDLAQDERLATALKDDPAWLLLRDEGKRPLPWAVALRKKPLAGPERAQTGE
jgi:hypothetical protein